MSKGFFITGSGTGVGKTYVSALLVQGFMGLDYHTTYMKPVETGCRPYEKDMIGQDTQHILNITDCKTDINQHSPYRFEPACSPHLAARMAGYGIDINHIINTYNDLIKKTSADIIIVEGAGGLLVPVNDNQYMADMISALGLGVILVTDPGLGTLNHTFLSIHELERRKIPILGVVINNARGVVRDFIFEDNVEIIRQHVDPAPCLIVDYGVDYNIECANSDITNNTVLEFCNGLTSRA